MVTVRFVGPKPMVSDKGVRFDASAPDPYIYLGAALQLAQAFDVEGEAKDIVYQARRGELSETEIASLLVKYCENLDQTVEVREEKARALVEELKQRVEEATTLSEEARRARLGNIEAVYGHYLQYVTNEAAYECVLERIAREIETHRIKEIRVPLLSHFGMVLHHLSERLEHRKPPIDSEYHVEQTDEGLVAVVKLRHL